MRKEIIEELTSTDRQEQQSILQRHIKNGVIIPIENGIFIGKNVTIGSGTVLLPGSVLTGDTKIGKSCHIGPDTWLFDTEVGDGSSLNNVQSYVSKILEGADIGPYVHIRPNSVIGNKVHLGNFVEVKNSTVGDSTSVSHLTYIGDSDVGKNVNFGCGCVTVNFTGKEKFRTKVGDHAFIGCNTNLVAPVTVGDYGYTAAGSTITDDVPENALAIARARQVNKEDWVTVNKPYRDQK